MKIWKTAKHLPWLCVAALHSTAWAQAPSPSPNTDLSLEQAQALALAHNPELAAAQAQTDAALALARQQSLWPNPSLSYSQEDAGKPDRSHSVELSWPLELGGKRSARQALAQSEALLTDGERQALAAKVRAQTTAAYFALVLAQEGQRLANDSAALAAQAAQAAGKRVAAGKISPVEHSRALAAQALAQAQALQAAAAQRQASADLALWLGQEALPEHTQLSAAKAETLPRLPAWPPLQAALEAGPAAKNAQLQLARSQAAGDLTRSARWPDVTLSLGVKRGRDAQTPRQQILLGVSFPLPLFDRQQGAMQAAQLQEQAVRERQRASRLASTQALRSAYENYQSAVGELQLLQTQALPAAQSADRAARIGFEYGKFSFLELLDAQRSWLAAQNQALQTQANAYRALAEIESLLGQPLSELAQAAPLGEK